jgi:predicted HTH transcriptional regulator
LKNYPQLDYQFSDLTDFLLTKLSVNEINIVNDPEKDMEKRPGEKVGLNEVSSGLNEECNVLSGRLNKGINKENSGIFEKDDEGGQTGGQTILNVQQMIISLIKADPKISRKEMAKKIGINTSAIQKHINNLKRAGIISS